MCGLQGRRETRKAGERKMDQGVSLRPVAGFTLGLIVGPSIHLSHVTCTFTFTPSLSHPHFHTLTFTPSLSHLHFSTCASVTLKATPPTRLPGNTYALQISLRQYLHHNGGCCLINHTRSNRLHATSSLAPGVRDNLENRFPYSFSSSSLLHSTHAKRSPTIYPFKLLAHVTLLFRKRKVVLPACESLSECAPVSLIALSCYARQSSFVYNSSPTSVHLSS
jgi:hypothetical protein